MSERPYPQAAPSAQALREFIQAQACPWCGKGPFTMLAGHTQRQHGVSAAELRRMAVLNKDAPLCSPDLSQTHREARQGRQLPEKAYENLRKRREQGLTIQLSEAGRASHRNKLAKVRTPEARAKMGRTLSRRMREASAEVHAEVVRLADEPLTRRQVAQRVGLSPDTVSRIWREHGIRADERQGRPDTSPLMSRMDEQAAQDLRERLARNREKYHERQRQESLALATEFIRRGSTLAALKEMAAERGISGKSLGWRIKKHGAQMPPGWSQAGRRQGGEPGGRTT